MTTVSVIIPTCDRIDVLPRALDSVLNQSRPADEIIVVDDGSRDGTGQLIKNRYHDVSYRYQPNAGVSSARNLGVSLSRGDWLAFLDSDDEWLPDKLAHQVDAIAAASDTLLCHTDEIWIRNGRRVNPMRKHAKSGGYIFERCLPLCAISPSSVLVRRSLFDELGGFDESLPACEDYDLWLRICARYPVVYLEKKLIRKYGGHQDQLSRRHWGMDRFRVQALTNLLESCKLNEEQAAAAIRTLASKCQVLAQGALKRGQFERARHYERLMTHYDNAVTTGGGDS